MGRFVHSALVYLTIVSLVSSVTAQNAERLDRWDGFFVDSAKAERDWETKYRAIPSPDNLLEYMRLLSTHPHHVGSPYDKQNAEWILSRFKAWGWDAHIESFDVLFPTPREGALEMIEPMKFVAKLEEPNVPVDPTSNQKSEQLPTYNAYSADGDVTGPNYTAFQNGNP